jgi:hypothetical protein
VHQRRVVDWRSGQNQLTQLLQPRQPAAGDLGADRTEGLV